MDGEIDGKPGDGAAARQRSELLRDAAKRARQLRVTLEQADALEDTGFNSVLRRIEAAADAAPAFSGKLYMARAKYPPRSPRDRGSDRPDVHLFVDESGQAEDVWKPGKSGLFFTLGAIAIRADAHKQYRIRAEQLKRKFFKDGTDVILHASELREAMNYAPRGKGEFTLNDGKSWRGLMGQLGKLVKETEFTAFGIIIQKEIFNREFTETGKDPFLPRETYDLALHLLLERFTSFLASEADAPIGSIKLESQSPERDAPHQLSIAETIAYGTRWVSPYPLQRDIRPGVEFLDKQPSHPLELSDLLANLLYRLANNGYDRPPRLGQGDEGLWEIFCSKFYQEGDLRQGKFGLKVFPAGRLDAWLNDFREKWRRET